MPRKHATKVIIETRMPDGGWITLPGTKKRKFATIPEAEEFVHDRIQSGDIWRIARVTGEYHIEHRLVKR